MFPIDTEEIELWLTNRGDPFRRGAFVSLVASVTEQLGIADKIESLAVHGPDNARAEMWREPSEQWPQTRLHLDIYPCRYLERSLLTHEFGHERDRHDSSMSYDPEIEGAWHRSDHFDLFELVVNISLDSRLGSEGLGREYRKDEFKLFVQDHPEYFSNAPDFFEKTWAHPPSTWPEMDSLAHQIAELV